MCELYWLNNVLARTKSRDIRTLYAAGKLIDLRSKFNISSSWNDTKKGAQDRRGGELCRPTLKGL
jgi:hypothetical protein